MKINAEAINNDKTCKIMGVHPKKENAFIKYQSVTPQKEGRGIHFLKTEEEIVKYAIEFGLKKEDCYCKICGKLLVSPNTTIWLSTYNKSYSLVFNNKHCFLNAYTFNMPDTVYRVGVCDDCLFERFEKTFRPNDRFQVLTDYAQFAFNVPETIFQKYKSDSFGINNEEHYIKKYGEVDGPIKYAEYVKSIAMTLDNQIKKHGEEDGQKRWEAYCKQQALTNTFEYKNQKYGMTKSEFKKYNKSRAVTKENLIKKHGEEEGIEKWEDYRRKQRYSVSLPYFIETYGEEEGRKLYDNFNNSRDYHFGGRSKIADEFCTKLAENFSTHEIYYGENEYDLITYDKDFYRPDYYDKTLNLVVEFYGDYYHSNRPEWPTKEEDDKVRIQKIIKTLSCKVIIVWENSYRQDPEELINSLLFEINHLNEMKECSIKVF